MRANELMIGDWVMYHNTPRQVVYINDRRLRELHNNEIGFTHDEDEWIAAHNASPIPLTPEILEKNGFETKFGYSKYNDEDDFFLVTWNSISHHLRVRTFDNDCAFDKDHIDYVHELQHALRLCGLNDLADNLKV